MGKYVQKLFLYITPEGTMTPQSDNILARTESEEGVKESANR